MIIIYEVVFEIGPAQSKDGLHVLIGVHGILTFLIGGACKLPTGGPSEMA